MSSFIRAFKSFAGVLAPKDLPKTAGLLGSTGRLGSKVYDRLSNSGAHVHNLPRDFFRRTPKEQSDYLRSKRIAVIINCTGATKGSLDALRETNFHGPYQLAQVASDLGIKFLQTSTAATQIHGIGPDTPYALTKKEAEEALLSQTDAQIARMDVLIGDKESTQISIGHLAGCKGLPLSVHLRNHQIFQPTSYDAVSCAISKLAEDHLAGAQSIPRVVNLVGDPIAVNEFTDLINPESIRMIVDGEELIELAKMVNNGSLTPEFIRLAGLASKHPVILDNTAFKELLGAELPTPEALAEMEQISFLKMLNTYKAILAASPDKRALIIEALKVIQKARFLKPV